MDFYKAEGAEKVSDEMSMAWVNFAKTGDPNCSVLPDKWLPYKIGDEHTFVFDKESECRGRYDTDMYDYMQANCPIHVLPF